MVTFTALRHALPLLLLAQLCNGVALSGLAAQQPLFSHALSAEQQPLAVDRPGALDFSQEHYLDVPVDHFHNDSRYEPHINATFGLRYYFDDSFYKKGGPVFVLAAGETPASDRLPYLQKGILYLLAQEFGGIGVVLEHRYYGQSFPGNASRAPSVAELRFLTTDQALADTAFFAQHVEFPGLEGFNLTSHTTPWIAYGGMQVLDYANSGSYAGAFVAFLRKLYPDTFFGAISSSGVTTAIVDYWQYFEPIRRHGPQVCIHMTELFTNITDRVFETAKTSPALALEYKQLFELTEYPDIIFAEILTAVGIEGWQGLNWDPQVSSTQIADYCGNITAPYLVHDELDRRAFRIFMVLRQAGIGYEQATTLILPVANWVGYVRTQLGLPLGARALARVTSKRAMSTLDGETDPDRLTAYAWTYQVCTQWGYFLTGSGVPRDRAPLVPRMLTLDVAFQPCIDLFNITKPPDVEHINRLGGFGFSYPRLAIVDGEWDPWLEATPHAPAAPPRNSTPSEPFYLIPAAVHHWDENGLLPNETTAELPPKRIRDVQSLELAWVRRWLDEAGLLHR